MIANEGRIVKSFKEGARFGIFSCPYPWKWYIIKQWRFMDIVILDSARKHGITDESIYSCLFNVRGGILLNDSPPKHLLAGFDHLGRALELVVIEDEERNRIVVIHVANLLAMKLQKQNTYLLGD